MQQSILRFTADVFIELDEDGEDKWGVTIDDVSALPTLKEGAAPLLAAIGDLILGAVQNS